MTRRIILIVAVLVMALAGAVLFPKAREWVKRMRIPDEKDRVAQLIRVDLSNLKKADATEYEVYAALIRLAQMKSPRAREEAFKRAGSASPIVREGVAAALGYFDDTQCLDQLSGLLKDRVSTVRQRAIEGLGMSASPEREKILRKLVAAHSGDRQEKLLAYISLVRVTSSAEEKAKVIQSWVKEAKKDQLSAVSLFVLLKMIGAAPRDPQVLAFLHEIIDDERVNELNQSLAIRHLSSLKDEMLRDHLEKYLGSAKPQVRAAAIQGIHLLCPKNRVALIEAMIKNEKDSHVLELVQSESGIFKGREDPCSKRVSR